MWSAAWIAKNPERALELMQYKDNQNDALARENADLRQHIAVLRETQVDLELVAIALYLRKARRVSRLLTLEDWPKLPQDVQTEFRVNARSLLFGE